MTACFFGRAAHGADQGAWDSIVIKLKTLAYTLLMHKVRRRRWFFIIRAKIL
jgi:hypothetical protein